MVAQIVEAGEDLEAYAAMYKYGFNGKENDNEVKGTGNQQDYGMRIYDPRLGRFLSIDPLSKKFPMLTPYQFGSNNPIWNIDLDGLEGVPYYVLKSAGLTTATAKQSEYDVKHRIIPVTRDVMIIGGALMSIVASDGISYPFVSGVFGSIGGSTKLYFDLKGDHQTSESMPTTISGTVLVTINYSAGEQKISSSFIATTEFVEGVLSLDFKNFKEVDPMKIGSESMNVINLTIDGFKLPKDLEKLMSIENSNLSSPRAQTETPIDKTSVAMPIKQEIIIPPTQTNSSSSVKSKPRKK